MVVTVGDGNGLADLAGNGDGLADLTGGRLAVCVPELADRRLQGGLFLTVLTSRDVQAKVSGRAIVDLSGHLEVAATGAGIVRVSVTVTSHGCLGRVNTYALQRKTVVADRRPASSGGPRGLLRSSSGA